MKDIEIEVVDEKEGRGGKQYLLRINGELHVTTPHSWSQQKQAVRRSQFSDLFEMAEGD